MSVWPSAAQIIVKILFIVVASLPSSLSSCLNYGIIYFYFNLNLRISLTNGSLSLLGGTASQLIESKGAEWSSEEMSCGGSAAAVDGRQAAYNPPIHQPR